MKPARARTDLASTEADVAADLKAIRAALAPADKSPEDLALCRLETFAAVAVRVMQKTNPSKIRDCARTVEIKARIDGVPVE
ncbi:hypothetical protein [Caldimonas tepidiphila]|uniref:hypothetical protein n=1 Tax=Caldimonas tepidiphila TaxID=2315841 RepID=UPI000E5C3964|nr:hypothetical protein [Caldimonas tepidiphila]